jgi:hypothetical protein
MLAGSQRRCGLRVVQVIRRGDVDHIDPGIGQHRLEALVRWRQLQRGGALCGPRVAGSNHPVHLHAQPAQSLDMHGSDEPRADNGRANFGDRT